MSIKTWWKRESEETRATVIFGAVVMTGVLAGGYFLVCAMITHGV